MFAVHLYCRIGWMAQHPRSINVQAGAAEMLKLKDEGNKLFGRKEYQKALESYDKALKCLNPESKEDLALLHANKAACYMMFQRYIILNLPSWHILS